MKQLVDDVEGRVKTVTQKRVSGIEQSVIVLVAAVSEIIEGEIVIVVGRPSHVRGEGITLPDIVAVSGSW